jgi:hypothetical protein
MEEPEVGIWVPISAGCTQKPPFKFVDIRKLLSSRRNLQSLYAYKKRYQFMFS